jgi:hypothetical protein
MNTRRWHRRTLAAALVVMGAPLALARPAAAGFSCSYAISDVTMAEGDSGTTNFVFTVTRTSGSVPNLDSVAYTTEDGTATAGQDYTTTTGTLNFAAIDTSKTITVPVTGDTAAETDETFNVKLSGPSSQCTFSDNTGVGTITNDDTAPPPPPPPPSTPNGYRLNGIDGGVFNYGESTYKGSANTIEGAAPIVDLEETPDRSGYWQVGLDGGIFAWNAPFYQSMGGHELNAPIIGMAARPQGDGYWEVALDGGVFAFGAAPFKQSMGGHELNSPIISIVPSPDGEGYWLLAADGGVFAFGSARYFGSAVEGGGEKLGVSAMWPTVDGGGYWLVTLDGHVISYGNAVERGEIEDPDSLQGPIIDIRGTSDGAGYWLLGLDGGVFGFNAPFYGSAASIPPDYPVIAMAGQG